jgi:hypothetical protein
MNADNFGEEGIIFTLNTASGTGNIQLIQQKLPFLPVFLESDVTGFSS